jgi:hypothetical protein
MTDVTIVLDVSGVQMLLAQKGVSGFCATTEAERVSGRRRVYRLARLGRIPSFIAAGRLRFFASEVEAVVRRGAL